MLPSIDHVCWHSAHLTLSTVALAICNSAPSWRHLGQERERMSASVFGMAHYTTTA